MWMFPTCLVRSWAYNVDERPGLAREGASRWVRRELGGPVGSSVCRTGSSALQLERRLMGQTTQMS
jgi:hypothetical protein